jgi:hypothetical protein
MTPGRFITGHPYLSAAGFLAIVVCVVLGIGATNAILHAGPLVQVALVDSVLACAGILVLVRLSWWEKAGYTSWIRWRDVPLFIPLIAVALLSFTSGIPKTAPLILFAVAGLTLVVGFAEELWFRGLILTALFPVGVLRATAISAVCFALPHLLNVLGGTWDPAFTVVDTIAAFGLGFTFAALRIRSGSIWPLVGVHALFDFTSIVAIGGVEVHAQSLPLLVSSVAVGAAFVVYGLFLLQGTRKPEPEQAAT